MIDSTRSTPRHPMRLVIQRTGLSADVLRAWEKRYGVVAPERSEGGQRLYSDEDVERLALLHRATAAGRNIGQICQLGLTELEALILQDESQRAARTTRPERQTSQAQYFLDAAFAAIKRLDAVELDSLLRRAAMQLSAAAVVDDVIVPLLREVGESWHRGELSPAHEHMGTAAIRRVLAWISGSAIVSSAAPTVLVATPANQRHELGAKIVATTAATEGWRVVFLGADLPADAIANAAVQAQATLVALSLIFPLDDPELATEVLRLRSLLPPRVLIVAGGPAAVANAAALKAEGVRIIEDLEQLRILFRSLHPAPPEYR
jgi:DNA-binding transcriptional MerR regulator/methylmalonyl-CoA mutase cobalamin-binding subunit